MKEIFYGGGGPVFGSGVTVLEPTAEDLQIQPISDHQWRVTDRRFPETDPHNLLGFIEAVGDGYEVMTLGAGYRWSSCASLKDATTLLEESGSTSALAFEEPAA